MVITTKTISRHCTADLTIKRDETLQGATFKKNDGEKENSNSSTQKAVKKVEKQHESFNVYTKPLANPKRNPNVDPKRTEPLTDQELGRVIRELYFEKVERIVFMKKHNHKFR